MKITYKDFYEKCRDWEWVVEKLDIMYNESDSRCWTAVVNTVVDAEPQNDNILVTLHVNKERFPSQCFDVHGYKRTVESVHFEDVYDLVQNFMQTKEKEINQKELEDGEQDNN